MKLFSFFNVRLESLDVKVEPLYNGVLDRYNEWFLHLSNDKINGK